MFVNEIINQVEEGVYDPHIFKAVFMAGGPGSGKSYIAKSRILKGGGLKIVNSDDIFEYKMKKAGLDHGDPEVIYSPQGQEVRNQAKQMTGRMEDRYLDGRLGLIIDGTGRDVDKIARAKEKLVTMGYSCIMVFVNTSLDIAQERNLERERVLPADEVEKMWNAVQNNMMKFQQLFGDGKFQIVDNNGGLEDPERAENFRKVEKNITAFISRPPSNRYAKKWIDTETRKKNATNQQE
jgi:cytidylate kinase